MTDLEKLKALLTEFGVEFEIKSEYHGTGTIISTEQGAAKVDGYGGFCTMFYFEADGSFRLMGAWE